eukprot:SAG31_NODE_4617_length_3092_cov_3.405947_3_plen_77_part_00
MSSLFVSNVPWSTTNEALVAAFAPYGAMSAEVQVLASGRSKGWALVTISGDPAACIAAMHDTEFEGRQLIVRADTG